MAAGEGGHHPRGTVRSRTRAAGASGRAAPLTSFALHTHGAQCAGTRPAPAQGRDGAFARACGAPRLRGGADGAAVDLRTPRRAPPAAPEAAASVETRPTAGQPERAGATKREGVQELGGRITITAHRYAVSCLKVVRDGERELLISADGGGLILVWETDTFSQVARLEGHRLGVASLALRRTAEGSFELFSGGYDNNIWQWCLVTMKVRLMD